MQQIELAPKLRQLAEVKNKTALFIAGVETDWPASTAGLRTNDIPAPLTAYPSKSR